jgi:uncharacterized protein DUF1707/2TM domain-containing protein
MAVSDHRASDAEREATADRLRLAAGDGRLDPEELEQRLEAAYGARTVGNLAELTRDLPATTAPAARLPDRDWASPAVRGRLASFIVVNTICIAIWAASGGHGSFWPIWVILGTGIGLFATVVRRALGVEEEHEHRRHRRRSRLEPPPPRR